ncbi:MetQ/NlpA family ABC transporter substrate-binding protein [bacterium LRH843]|nr:MetQ/NlpA family ABC transporter substrate-binding protein [bacterium LRH843]
MKKLFITALTALSVIGLTACGGGSSSGELPEDKLRVGVTAGPHEIVLGKVIELAAEEGLEIEPTIFSEYVMPNVALDEGELDMNIFQHKPFLDKMNADRGFDIVDVAPAVNFPMAIYSDLYGDVAELQEGDTVGLPNDPSNGARALLLFELAGIIKLDPDAGTEATVNDIVENPKNLEFIELEASQIPRQLSELSAAAINTNYAIEHDINPREDSIFLEPSDSIWTNLIAVRAENKDDAVVQKFVEIYRSEEVKQFIEEEFNGSVLASW